MMGTVSAGQAQTAESLSPHGALKIECQDCHTLDAWRPIKAHPSFDHDTTDYPLAGKHIVTPCRSCHLNLRFDQPKLEGDPCGLCHVDVHQGKFVQSCESCHGFDSFEVIGGGELVHNQTAFPLTGAHREAACQACHFDDRNGAFTNLDTNCFFCHEVILDAAPGHMALDFPNQCEMCHTTFSWTDGLFNHATVAAGFSLIGAHAVASCESCHAPATFEPLFHPSDQNDCITCHQAAYDRQHAGRGTPFNCLMCHTQNQWGR